VNASFILQYWRGVGITWPYFLGARSPPLPRMTPCIQALSLYRRVKMGQKAHYVAETLWATERVEDFTLGIINVRLMSRNREKCLVNAYDRGIRMRMAGGCRFRVVSCCGLIGSEESEGWAKILVYSSGLKSAHCNQRDNQTTPPNWTKLASCHHPSQATRRARMREIR
jgi:hypothetical protein